MTACLAEHVQSPNSFYRNLFFGRRVLQTFTGIYGKVVLDINTLSPYASSNTSNSREKGKTDLCNRPYSGSSVTTAVIEDKAK